MYEQKTHIAWFATKAEMRIIEQLKEKLKRSSNSDLMRYLNIMQPKVLEIYSGLILFLYL